MKTNCCLLHLIFLLFISTIQGTYSQEAYSKEFGIISDNDLYTSFYYDRYYTNGTFIYYRCLSKQEAIKKIHEFRIGQKMYTPQFSSSESTESIDRPYAGYTFIKYSLKFFSKKNYSLNSSFELGVLGPKSKAQETQEIIHNLYGFNPAIGWEYQIQNATGINFDFEFTKPFSRNQKKQIDFTSVSSLKLGTIISEITTAIYGRINLFKTPLNFYDNSILFESNLNHKQAAQKKELFLFLKPQIGYAFYNATIQGSLFNDKSPVTYDINPFLYEIEFGIKYAIKKMDLSYAIIKYSKKTDAMKENTNTYGSIKIAYKFN